MATQDASDAGANVMLDSLVSGTANTLYVGLSSTAPNKNGTNINPPPGVDYQRAVVTFPAAAARKRANSIVANFVVGGGAATTSQGAFTHATFHSAATAGVFYASTPLSQTLNWQSGFPVTMAVGDVTLEFEAS